MEWFEKVSDFAKDAATKTARIAKDKSGEIYEITKLSIAISEAESKIDKLFKNVGILTYRDYENGFELSEDITALLKDVDGKFKEIEEMKAKINEIKSVKTCPKCNASNAKSANFCQNCGEILENA